MHMVIESIKEEHAEQDHKKQDQLIEYFMEAFNQEIILNKQIIQSGLYTRSWEYHSQMIKNRLFYFQVIFAYLQIVMAELI